MEKIFAAVVVIGDIVSIKATHERNLEVNNPALAREWHPTKNGNLTPRDEQRALTKKYGGSVQTGMNGKRIFIAETRERAVASVICKDAKGS